MTSPPGPPQDDFNAATCSSQQTGEAAAAIAADPAANAPGQRQSVIAAGGVVSASLVSKFSFRSATTLLR
jgi:hypothetical protein